MKTPSFKTEKLKPVFEDKRGKIFDIVEDPISHIGFITFKKGAVRGNHYHKKSTQYTYVIAGKIELYTKDARNPDAPVTKTVMTPGFLAVIPPHTIHVYRAVTPSSMIDCTTANRLKQGYENDTVRIDAALVLKK